MLETFDNIQYISTLFQPNDFSYFPLSSHCCLLRIDLHLLSAADASLPPSPCHLIVRWKIHVAFSPPPPSIYLSAGGENPGSATSLLSMGVAMEENLKIREEKTRQMREWVSPKWFWIFQIGHPEESAGKREKKTVEDLYKKNNCRNGSNSGL